MKNLLYFTVFAMLIPGFAVADISSLENALRATYTACVGIDDSLAEMKTLAGINTAVTSVGTGAGIGATTTGFIKAAKDKEIENLKELIDFLKKQEEEGLAKNAMADEIAKFESDFFAALNNKKYTQEKTSIKSKEDAETRKDKLEKQSVKLGNWRTGLLAGAAATNIAGAAIAGVNKVDKDLQTQIDECKQSVKNLRDSMMQARNDGIDITEAEKIVDACSQYEYVDISKINKRATGAMVSSTVGAATGLSGAVVSGVANSKKVREEGDASEAGKKKEDNLNLAANVSSVVTTAASATATIFNATQIAAIKKVADVAEKCTSVLK